MTKVLLLDVYTPAHVGNTALLDSSMANLAAALPDAEFTALAKQPGAFDSVCGAPSADYLFPGLLNQRERQGARKLVWLTRNLVWGAANTFNLGVLWRLGARLSPLVYSFGRRRRAVAALLEADAVVSISGEMMNDAFAKVAPFLLYGYWMAKKLGKPTVVFPQSIGPLRNARLRKLVRHVLLQCDLVIARDKPSSEELDRLGVEHELIPDVAVLQPAISSDEAATLLGSKGVRRDESPVVGMTVSAFREKHGTGQGYLDELPGVIRHVTQELGGQVVLLCANVPHFDEQFEDVTTTRALLEALDEESRKRTFVVDDLLSARQFKGIQQRCDLFVTTRMHAGILASMGGTPTITINTQRKLAGYMEMIGQSACSVDADTVTAEGLSALVDETLANRDSISQALTAKQQELKPWVLESGQRVARLLQQERGKQE